MGTFHCLLSQRMLQAVPEHCVLANYGEVTVSFRAEALAKLRASFPDLYMSGAHVILSMDGWVGTDETGGVCKP